jgi:hypothetical protein
MPRSPRLLAASWCALQLSMRHTLLRMLLINELTCPQVSVSYNLALQVSMLHHGTCTSRTEPCTAIKLALDCLHSACHNAQAVPFAGQEGGGAGSHVACRAR